MNNNLVKISHKDKGTWYCSNIGKATHILNLQYSILKYHMDKHGHYKGWTIEWVDGSEIPYKLIDPDYEDVHGMNTY